MKFALVENLKKEPSPKLKGICPGCGATMIAKCGKQKIWHWAHSKKQNCDPWWENETAWHRDWKNRFPTEWQEVPSKDEDGIIHIADIKRPDGFHIEFQYSPISEDEVESRSLHYKNLVWVVNGTRSKKDLEKLEDIRKRAAIGGGALITRLNLKIAKKWNTLAKHVFIDFEDSNQSGQRRIFYLCNDRFHQFLIEITVSDFVFYAKERGGLKPFIQSTDKAKQKLIEIETEPDRKRQEWAKKYVEPFWKKYSKLER